MNGMSEREYSTHSGLSRGAVQNAKRGGRLEFYADGSINAAASDVRRADMTDPDQQKRSLGGDAACRLGALKRWCSVWRAQKRNFWVTCPARVLATIVEVAIESENHPEMPVIPTNAPPSQRNVEGSRVRKFAGLAG